MVQVISIESGVQEGDHGGKSIDKLEILGIELNNGRRNIPAVVEMVCPSCGDREYGKFIGLGKSNHGLFLAEYTCECCSDTQSVIIVGDYHGYTF
ncbi:MAG: hypothetical protein Q7S56_04190 [Nanoarchaeota archaeon]|nr:hypothetical protein [Nanoarchaeota archaeon]